MILDCNSTYKTESVSFISIIPIWISAKVIIIIRVPQTIMISYRRTRNFFYIYWWIIGTLGANSFNIATAIRI